MLKCRKDCPKFGLKESTKGTIQHDCDASQKRATQGKNGLPHHAGTLLFLPQEWNHVNIIMGATSKEKGGCYRQAWSHATSETSLSVFVFRSHPCKHAISSTVSSFYLLVTAWICSNTQWLVWDKSLVLAETIKNVTNIGFVNQCNANVIGY